MHNIDFKPLACNEAILKGMHQLEFCSQEWLDLNTSLLSVNARDRIYEPFYLAQTNVLFKIYCVQTVRFKFAYEKSKRNVCFQ